MVAPEGRKFLQYPLLKLQLLQQQVVATYYQLVARVVEKKKEVATLEATTSYYYIFVTTTAYVATTRSSSSTHQLASSNLKNKHGPWEEQEEVGRLFVPLDSTLAGAKKVIVFQHEHQQSRGYWTYYPLALP